MKQIIHRYQSEVITVTADDLTRSSPGMIFVRFTGGQLKSSCDLQLSMPHS